MFKGAYTALVTPFKDGKINYNKMAELIEFQINEGIVSSTMLAEAITKAGTDAKNLHTLDNIAKHIHEIIKPNDIVLTIGAGTITKLADLL